MERQKITLVRRIEELQISSSDVLVLKFSKEASEELVRTYLTNLAAQLAKKKLETLIIAVSGELEEIKVFDAQEMAKYGWIKAPKSPVAEVVEKVPAVVESNIVSPLKANTEPGLITSGKLE